MATHDVDDVDAREQLLNKTRWDHRRESSPELKAFAAIRQASRMTLASALASACTCPVQARQIPGDPDRA